MGYDSSMQRQRLTITLTNQIVQALDESVDGELLRNRSQALEHFLKEGLGIHALTQAFLFFTPDWEQENLEAALTLCQSTTIQTFYLVLPAAQLDRQTEIEAIVHEHYSPTCTTQVVPSDFGSAAAVLLQKSQLDQAFLLAFIDKNRALPANLLPAYIFHRGHRGTLTSLVYSSDSLTYQSSGIVIANPELLQYIPAGLSSLVEDVFPEVIKQGKLRAYAYHL